ncbi:50S ribosomal protein L9 [Candidatus Nitrosoglobus terrae]|uniref:Large ribosomal subunit protein bL9 n=1 Tax=Candidatus Nitrosoglobus terrae TaxID=1630141 RepID=A0A1Q2SKS8_9GAMM|nr:50S ribosomal protein L9 [Candidatus Nitrosoglobus terrae]BAW79712.1 50S ribosomal protein L9 [Candidatus Nitrosoglobus terrae]
MEVILLEQMPNLGKLGEKVAVKAGYARNYLIPRRKAVIATKDNDLYFESRRAELEKAAAESVMAAEKRKQALIALGSVTITAKVGVEGKLFGSVGAADITNALTRAGFEIDKKEIRLPYGSLRQIGEYELEVHLYSGIIAPIKVVVAGEE